MAKRYSAEDVLRFLDGNSSDIEELMSTDDEVLDKDWTPNADYDEENSSTGSSNEEDKTLDDRLEEEEEGLTTSQATKQRGRSKVKSKEERRKAHTAAEIDKSDDQISTEGGGPTVTQAKRTNKSAKKKVKTKEYRWRKAEFDPPDVPFIESADEGIEERCEFTPYMYFKQFVTEDMIQLVADQTNLFSVQKEGKSVNTNFKEIEQVLGMYMFMGLVQMPNVRAYWEIETKYPKVADVMSRDRFEKLLTLLHFQDNLSVSEDAKKDKLWKLRPWLEKLQEQCLHIPPEEHHAVDEIMIPFKGRSHLKVYMPAKPHKWGFKMWGRAGQSGFLYDFDVCQGAADPDKERSEVGVSGDVVLKSTSTLPAGKNHKVFADNYFTSLPLLEHLWQRGIYYLGTIRMNRVPNCSMKDEKDLRKQGRGSMDYRVNQNNVIVVRWCDNKPVNLVSSFVGITPQDHVKR
ncbi:piggyBac transposable element-derived protein 3-like [Epinephelus fuscoguttatus]|uniref:piggyBac transposable element-derived protein 3-like n=1 Tax=Epinephelus fuscoguttatus TaxID=293821 RepID=UPI0020D067E0|nr:piggyBac transposable element-derived protein 3-like [Epinephelus fuscoguttatus]